MPFPFMFMGLLGLEVTMFTPAFIPCHTTVDFTLGESSGRSVSTRQVDVLRRREVRTETGPTGETRTIVSQYDGLNRLSEIVEENLKSQSRSTTTISYGSNLIRSDSKHELPGGRVDRNRSDWIDRNGDGVWDEVEDSFCSECPAEAGLIKNVLWRIEFSADRLVSGWRTFGFENGRIEDTFIETRVERTQDGSVSALIEGNIRFQVVEYWNQASRDERRKGQKILRSAFLQPTTGMTCLSRYDSLGREVTQVIRSERRLSIETTHSYACRD